MGTRLDRKELEKLREAKRSRGFWRLDSSETIESEFKGQFVHPSSYAYVRFECHPADDLSFEVQASWPYPNGDSGHRPYLTLLPVPGTEPEAL